MNIHFSPPEMSGRTSFRFIAAPFTPLCSDGSLNLGLIEKYADKLCREGVTGAFVCGTTGEGMSLSQAERKSVAEAWKSAAAGRLQVIVHVGHCAVEEARDLARHAEKIQADGIATIGPVFFTPSSPTGLIQLSQRVAAAALDTPFYYYHMPSMSRAQFTASTWFEAMAEAIPNFAGVKFTHEDLVDFQKCVRLAGDRYEVFFGRDELLLESLAVGAASAVGSTYNFATPLYRLVTQSYRQGESAEAERVQALCTQAIDSMVRHGGLPAIKATLALSGIDCGPMRLPIRTLEHDEIQALEAELEALGYFEAIQSAAQMPDKQESDLALAHG